VVLFTACLSVHKAKLLRDIGFRLRAEQLYKTLGKNISKILTKLIELAEANRVSFQVAEGLVYGATQRANALPAGCC
jgi:hypothetical protein